MSNADLLDSIHGSASREANKYLALGADAMFPDGAVRNIQGGLDADKPASPKRSDMYIAWDTGRVYACFTAGAWTDITPIVGDVRLMAYNYSINEHKYIAIDPDTKALRIKKVVPPTLLQLVDFPSSYAGHAGKYPRVKAGEDGLEFTTLPTGVTDHGELTGLGDDDHVQYYNSVRHTLAVHDTLGLLKKSGGVMTEPLTLSGAPTVNLHAATKKYVDDHIVTRELFFGRLTSDQYMGDGGNININTADVDTLGGFDSANHRYVIQNSGYFGLIGQMWVDGGVVNQMYQVGIRINNASRQSPCTNIQYWMTSVDYWRAVGATGDISPRAYWPAKHLNAGDYVQLWCWTGNVTVQGTEPYCGHKTFLSVVELMRD